MTPPLPRLASRVNAPSRTPKMVMTSICYVCLLSGPAGQSTSVSQLWDPDHPPLHSWL